MLEHDVDLSFSDLTGLTGREEVRGFFARLGYPVGAGKETFPDAEGMKQSLADAIQHVELVARDAEDLLDVYLIELSSVTVARVNDLGTHFKNRGGWVLAILTSDYERLDFVLFDLQQKEGHASSVRAIPRRFTVDRRHPQDQRVILRVLRRFSWTEPDGLAQWDKLRSAFSIGEWSEEFFDNRGLFSDYYLKERLPAEVEVWHAEGLREARREIGTALVEARREFAQTNEAALRAGLLEPVLQELGFELRPCEDACDDDTRSPDYELFEPDTGQKLAVCLAYQWDRFLDGPDPNDEDNEVENPGAAVLSVLEQEGNDWAIVTNGKQWRLYTRKTESRATNFFQVDAEESAADTDPNAFRYFWLLFRAEAFRKRETAVKGETRELNFVEELLEGSRDYAKQVGERLKDRVFEDIFPILAEGFVADIRAREGEEADLSQERLDLIYESTLVLLYRLLFLLFSESRDLLPVGEVGGYYEKSLTRLKSEIADVGGTVERQRDEKLAPAYSDQPRVSDEDNGGAPTLYDHLNELFVIVAVGRPAVNVPPYNGGLFVLDPDEALDEREKAIAEFLSTYALPNRHLARVIDRLARDIDDKTHGLAMIDYKSLGVRQLGSIYEGLLEFKLRIAPAKMTVCTKKGTEVILPYDEATKAKGVKIKRQGRGADAQELTIPEGAPYLENDKHERKSTGSYYTPGYIVNYIVEHTVGPVLEEKFAAMREDLDRACRDFLKLDKDRKNAGMKRPDGVLPDEKELIDRIFDMRVLDPAMGSGHFLVTAVDFIADRMIHFLNGFPGNPVERLLAETRRQILRDVEKRGIFIDEQKLTNVNLLKRHVLKRCLYGVDLNPMAVELAKVSLWLHCFTLGAPLSFLDHHLKSGNSLIGEVGAAASVAEQDGQATLGGMSRWDEFAQAVQSYMTVSQLADATADQVLLSRKTFQEAERGLVEHRAECNVLTAKYFEKWTDQQVGSAQQASTSEGREMFKRAQEVADEHSFFHWPLEFPEIWYGIRPGTENVIAPKSEEEQGFDAVVGNPPWGAAFDHKEAYYLRSVYAMHGKELESYALFVDLHRWLTVPEGLSGQIIPTTWLVMPYFSPMRKLLLTSVSLRALVLFRRSVFRGVTAEVMVLTYRKCYESGNQVHCVIDEQRDFQSNIVGRTLAHDQYTFLRECDYRISLLSTGQERDTALKLRVIGVQLDELFEVRSGIMTNGDGLISDRPHGDCWKPVLSGRDFERYFIRGVRQWILYDPEVADREGYALREERIFTAVPKLIMRQTGDSLVACYDSQRHYSLKNTHVIICRSGIGVRPCYGLSLLNSRLLNWYYHDMVPEEGRTLAEVKIAYVRQLPLRRLDFDHPSEKSAKEHELDRAIRAVKGGDYETPHDLAGDALAIHSVLHGPAGKPELRDDPYWKQQIAHADPDFPGREDFVHDLLAMLAQRMIHLNKEKHKEIDRFLTWLQDELGFDVEDLTGKSFVKAYYEHDWDELLRRLQQNKRHCTNPVDGLFVANIRAEYEASVEKLRPMEDALEKTDRLIDQIVYKLYGLTDEEIRIVEGV